jgi:hypothetical protein
VTFWPASRDPLPTLGHRRHRTEALKAVSLSTSKLREAIDASSTLHRALLQCDDGNGNFLTIFCVAYR